MVALAVLMLVRAVLLTGAVLGSSLGSALGGLQDVLGFGQVPDLLLFIQATPWVAAGLLLVSGLLVVSAIAMLAGHRNAWLLAMVLTGAFVAFDIFAFANKGASHVWMALNIITVFYLNQQDVRSFVGAAGEEPDEIVVP